MRDWPLLERAVDEKIEQQVEFVRWWTETVPGPGKVNSHRSGRIECDEAERLTGITHQQVSKWRHATTTERIDKYRAALFGVAYKKAMAGTATSSAGAHVAANSGENEWYTPAHFIEAARIMTSRPARF